MSRWYKRDGAAFIQGTMGLTLEEKGAYSLCLDLIYSNGGPIADDARWLSGVCGVSLRKWTTIRSSLIARGKLVAEGGFLMNPRAAHEIASLESDRNLNAENGAKGGRKRAENSVKSHETEPKPERDGAENDSGSSENNGLAQANRLDEIRVDENKEEESSLRSGEAAPPSEPSPPSKPKTRTAPKGEPTGFAEFYAEFPRKVARPAAAKAFAKALTRATIEVLLAGARRYANERRNEDQNFTKHPATWLNNDCWLDEEVTNGTTGQNGNKSTSHQRHRAGWAGLLDAEAGRSESVPESGQLALGAPAGRRAH